MRGAQAIRHRPPRAPLALVRESAGPRLQTCRPQLSQRQLPWLMLPLMSGSSVPMNDWPLLVSPNATSSLLPLAPEIAAVTVSNATVSASALVR